MNDVKIKNQAIFGIFKGYADGSRRQFVRFWDSELCKERVLHVSKIKKIF